MHVDYPTSPLTAHAGWVALATGAALALVLIVGWVTLAPVLLGIYSLHLALSVAVIAIIASATAALAVYWTVAP